MAKAERRPSLERVQEMNRGRQVDEPVFLTGYSDASWYHEDQRGGYGVWVRDATQQVWHGAPCPEWVVSSAEAEALAVCRAVQTAYEHLDEKTANVMVVKTDCKAIIGWFMDLRPKSLQMENEIRDALETLAWADIKLWVKWVRGHQGRHKSTQAYLNHRVDSMARRGVGESWLEKAPASKGRRS